MTADFEWSAHSPIGLDTLDLTGSRIIAVDDLVHSGCASEPAKSVSASSFYETRVEAPPDARPVPPRASRRRLRVMAVASLCALSALCGAMVPYLWSQRESSAFDVSITGSLSVPSPLRRWLDRFGHGINTEIRRLAVWPDTPGDTAVAASIPPTARETTLMSNRSPMVAAAADNAPDRAPVADQSPALTLAASEQQKQTPSSRWARLNLNASPWADVWVDGVFVGQTPMGNFRLRAGRHQVRFSHPELGERTIVASVRTGEVAHVTADFGQPARR